jgi:hypothetical protein
MWVPGFTAFGGNTGVEEVVAVQIMSAFSAA